MAEQESIFAPLLIRNANPARSNDVCAVALVLVLDQSGSIKKPDWETQVRATAAALRSEDVVQRIEEAGSVAINAIAFNHTVQSIVPWMRLENRADAERFAAALEEAGLKQRTYSGTDVATALDYAADSFSNAPCSVQRKVIDVSTDGGFDDTAAAEGARDRASLQGIRINGIGVGKIKDGPQHEGPPEQPTESLRRHVIYPNPGALLYEANSWADFEEMIRRKLSSELMSSNDVPSGAPVDTMVRFAAVAR